MKPLTTRCLTELRDNGDATASELAAILKEKPQTVSGTMTNLKGTGNVRVVGEKPVGRDGRSLAHIYTFVSFPHQTGRPWGGKRRRPAPEAPRKRREQQHGQVAGPITIGRGAIWGNRVGGQLVG